jgi:hypothetical protein
MVCAFEWSSPNILRPGTLPIQANITIITYFFKNLNNAFASKSVFQDLNIITILNIQDRTQRGDRGGGKLLPLRKLYL